MSNINALTDEVTIIISVVVKNMSGFLTNEQIFKEIEKVWPNSLMLNPQLMLTSIRIGKTLSRLGFKPWRTRNTRGWRINI